MSDDTDAKIPLTIHDAETGQKATLQLTPNAADALGMQLVASAGKNRGPDSTPMLEQQKMLLINEPPTELVYETNAEGRKSIALVFKANDMRPIWIWYDLETAVGIAQTILAMSAGKESPPN